MPRARQLVAGKPLYQKYTATSRGIDFVRGRPVDQLEIQLEVIARPRRMLRTIREANSVSWSNVILFYFIFSDTAKRRTAIVKAAAELIPNFEAMAVSSRLVSSSRRKLVEVFTDQSCHRRATVVN